MAEDPTSTYRIEDLKTFGELLAELERLPRTDISTILVDDQGMVEPARQGTAFVMQPRVRVVVTAFDHRNNRILRWQDKWDVGSGTVTIHAPSGHGTHRDLTGARTRDQAIAALKLKGFQVSTGEWTPQVITNVLAGAAGL